jgi:hypothetical protein
MENIIDIIHDSNNIPKPTDYKVLYEGEALPRKLNYPAIEIKDEDFSIFGIEKYERFIPGNAVIDFDKIYREDSKCTFTDLKGFVSAYIENFKSHAICHNELFIEPIVNNPNDTKTLDASIFYKLIHPEHCSAYADILLIVQKMDFS